MTRMAGTLKDVYPSLIEEFKGRGLDPNTKIICDNDAQEEKIKLIFPKEEDAKKFAAIILEKFNLTIPWHDKTLFFTHPLWDQLNAALHEEPADIQVTMPDLSTKTLEKEAAKQVQTPTAESEKLEYFQEVHLPDAARATYESLLPPKEIGYVFRTLYDDVPPEPNESCCHCRCMML